MRPVSISDLRSNIKKYFDSVVKSLDVLIVPTKSKHQEDGGVVIMSVQQYNSLCETSYLLSTPANREALRKSLAELENGQVQTFELKNLSALQPVK